MKKILFFLCQLLMLILIFPTEVNAQFIHIWDREEDWEWKAELEDFYIEDVLKDETVDYYSEEFDAGFEAYMQRVMSVLDTMTLDEYYDYNSSYESMDSIFLWDTMWSRCVKKATTTPDGFVIYNDVLLDYVGNSSKIVIPSNVTKIYGLNFCDRSHKIDQIIIPDSVTDIRYSFDMEDFTTGETEHLIDIKFAERNGKPLKIGNYCFSYLHHKSLKSLLPKETTEIGCYCFMNCDLSNFVIPDGIKVLRQGTFSDYSACNIVIPSSVTTIEAYVLSQEFDSNTYPNGYITIPNSVKSIEENCFNAMDEKGILCKKGSVAEQYCKKNKLSYRTNTKIEFQKKTYYVCVGSSTYIPFEKYNISNKVKFSIKNKSCAKTYEGEDAGYGINIEGKKPGNTVLTATLNGKTYKTNVVVLKSTTNNRVKQAVNNVVNSKMSLAEKAWNLSGWLRDQCIYDLMYAYEGKKTHKYSPHTAESALLEGYAVCDGFAKATKMLFDKAGLKNKIVYGTYNGMGHAWNLVKTEDGWVHIDNTNYMGSYYLDKEMKGSGYKWDAKKYPKTKSTWK